MVSYKHYLLSGVGVFLLFLALIFITGNEDLIQWGGYGLILGLILATIQYKKEKKLNSVTS